MINSKNSFFFTIAVFLATPPSFGGFLSRSTEIPPKLEYFSPCQQRTILKWEKIKDQKPPNNFLTQLAESHYPALSDYDKHFITDNPLKAGHLPIVSNLAFEFTRLTCGAGYEDPRESNAILHFALAMVASVQMGEESACEWTTGHELTNNFDHRDAVPSGMDLVNNRQGLLFSKEHLALSRKCVKELQLRTQAQKESLQESIASGLPSDTLAESRLQSLFEKDDAGVKNSCYRVYDLVTEERSKYSVVYVNGDQKRSVGDCSRSLPEEAQKRSMKYGLSEYGPTESLKKRLGQTITPSTYPIRMDKAASIK